MEAGYLATLKRIHRAGLPTVVIQDTPVSAATSRAASPKTSIDLEACAFRRVRDATKEFDARAAQAAPGTPPDRHHPRDLPHDLCRAVIGNALVYRDKSHLTATFARTLSPWIERGLKGAGLS